MVIQGKVLEEQGPSQTYSELQRDTTAKREPIGEPNIDQKVRPSSATAGPSHYYSYQLMGSSKRSRKFEQQDLELLASTVESHVDELMNSFQNSSDDKERKL